MIAWIFPGSRSFLRVCEYVCQDQKKSQTLDQEGVRGHDPDLMARDFETIHAIHPGRERAVFHAVLDFHRDEKPDDAKLVEIARRYLDELDMKNTQYAVVKHTDQPHLHVHIVANNIDYGGGYANNYLMMLNNKQVEKKLIEEFNLVPAQKKNLKETNFEALISSDQRAYRICQAISSALPACYSLDDLEARLSKQGIETQYRMNPETQEREGISFRLDQFAFKGSRIDRAFSLPRLEERLEQQQKIKAWEEEKLAPAKKQKQGSEEQSKLELWEKAKPKLTEDPSKNENLTEKEDLKKELWEQQVDEELREIPYRHSHRLRI